MSAKSKESSTVLDEFADAPPMPSESVAVEIDVEGVVDELQTKWPAASAHSDEFGFNRAVVEIDDGRSTPLVVSACPVCEGRKAWPTYAIVGTGFKVVTCIDCGLGRIDPMPGSEEIASFYPPEYYGVHGAKFESLVELMVRVVGARRVRALVRGIPKGARVLDVGCGRGVLLGELADQGCEAHGFEISRTAAEGADPRAKIRIASGLTEAGYDDGYFDQVILSHVLEHLPNPRETISEIRRILRPGGRLVVTVPNFSSSQSRWAGAAWFHLDLPRHLFHFPLSALKSLLQDCGFDCREDHHFCLRQNPFGWVQSFLNKRRSLPRNGLYRLLKRTEQSKAEMFDFWTRFRMKLTYFLGMPIALVASIFAAVFLTGASICIVAEAVDKRDDFDSSTALDTFVDTHPECFEDAEKYSVEKINKIAT